MTLGCEIVDLVRLHLLDDPNDVGGVRQVPVVQVQADMLLVRILVQVVDTIGVERGGAALDAMHLVAFVKEKLRQVCAILARNTGNQSAHWFSLSCE